MRHNPEFKPFPKVPRWNREMVITEKLDGTNALVHVTEDGRVLAGSRSRWITPEDDNFGFAAWVKDNEDELRQLGPGYHYGEWWGKGIQREYGLNERRFSLFNVKRWGESRPKCCHVVPVIGNATYPNGQQIALALFYLRDAGSYAAPGFMTPEGIVIYHSASNQCFKITLEHDDMPKGKAK